MTNFRKILLTYILMGVSFNTIKGNATINFFIKLSNDKVLPNNSLFQYMPTDFAKLSFESKKTKSSDKENALDHSNLESTAFDLVGKVSDKLTMTNEIKQEKIEKEKKTTTTDNYKEHSSDCECFPCQLLLWRLYGAEWTTHDEEAIHSEGIIRTLEKVDEIIFTPPALTESIKIYSCNSPEDKTKENDKEAIYEKKITEEHTEDCDCLNCNKLLWDLYGKNIQ